MSHLAIRLLGPPEVTLNQTPIHVDTRKAIALLAYLVVSGQHHRRDSLAAFLWPDSGQTRARASLRRTLSSLSNALDGGWLAINRDTIGFREDGEWSLDLAEFRSRLDDARTCSSTAIDELDSAVSIYRDDFMAGFGLRDSPPFDDWQFLQAEAARRDLAWALERLAALNAAAGEFSAAILHARRWLALDLLQEPAHRMLIQLYASLGDRASAIRQYRACVQILDQELGVGPVEETTALYAAIMENQMPALKSPAPSPPENSPVSRVPASFPLVGRSHELAELINAYDSVDQSGRLIVVEGEAGIGKTRLANELVTYAHGLGAATISGNCYVGESRLAYGVVAGMLRSSLALADSERVICELAPNLRDEVSRLLPELANYRSSLPMQMESPGALDRFYDGVIQYLLTFGKQGAPVLLFIDDVQWADVASINLLSYLIRRLHRSPLCMLVTWRSEDVGRSHDFRQLLARSQRDGYAALVRLGPLTSNNISELVDNLQIGPAKQLGRQLYEESEGIPFFAVEYLSQVGADLRSGVANLPIPGGVRDLIRSRLNAIGGTGQQLLTTAAVIRRSFDFDLLLQASGRSEAETIETLDMLLSRGLIRETVGPGRTMLAYDFGHEKVRSLLYEETSLARRRLIHQRVAVALRRRFRRRNETGGLAGQVAYHYRQAGMDAEAAKFYRLAGDYARSLRGNAEALSHYRTALALGHPEPAVLHEAIGDLETLEGSYAGALHSYQAAASHGDPSSLPAIEQKLGAIHQRLGDWKIAERHYEVAFAAFGRDRIAERARVLAEMSLAAHHAGDTQRALDIGRRARELAETSSDAATLAQTYNLLGILARSQGNAVETARNLEKSLKFANSMAEPGAKIAALNNLALVCADQGEFGRAMMLTGEALEHCRSLGDRHREAALLNNLADLHHMIGEDTQAMTYLKQAVAIFAEIDQRADMVRPEIWKLVEW